MFFEPVETRLRDFAVLELPGVGCRRLTRPAGHEVGGRVLLSVEIDGTKRPYGGPILIFQTARELTFSNNWETDAWAVPTLITLRLTALYDACHVELFHHGFERLGSDAGAELQGYESGWNSQHLDALKTIVES